MAESDSELLERAVGGDVAALRVLMKRHGPRLRPGIRSKIGKTWRALIDEDDVLQIVYLEAFLHIDQLKARNVNSFVSWLQRIAHNALLDTIRELEREKRPHPKRQLQPPVGQDSYVGLLERLGGSSTTPSRHAARDEAAKILQHVLTLLPADYRTVVRLYDLDGQSAREVARIMGRSVGAVHMLRARAHERMRQAMGSPSKFFSDSP